MLKIAKLLILLTLLPSCHGYIVHPGAVNTFDSVTYDTIMATQTTVETAREHLKNGVLPDRIRPILNHLIDVLNVAEPAHKVWHDLMLKNQPASDQLIALNKALSELTLALTAFKEAK